MFMQLLQPLPKYVARALISGHLKFWIKPHIFNCRELNKENAC